MPGCGRNEIVLEQRGVVDQKRLRAAERIRRAGDQAAGLVLEQKVDWARVKSCEFVQEFRVFEQLDRARVDLREPPKLEVRLCLADAAY